MTFAYSLTGLVTIISLLIFVWMSIKVGQARGKHETPAPAMQGPDDFMRVMRVHGNTLEGLVLFLPALWLFAFVWGDVCAALVGIVYPIGRLVYAQAYYAQADKRTVGFMIGFLATIILLLGALAGLAMAAIGTYS